METACKVTTLGCLANDSQHVTWKVNYNKSLFLEKAPVLRNGGGTSEEKS